MGTYVAGVASGLMIAILIGLARLAWNKPNIYKFAVSKYVPKIGRTGLLLLGQAVCMFILWSLIPFLRKNSPWPIFSTTIAEISLVGAVLIGIAIALRWFGAALSQFREEGRRAGAVEAPEHNPEFKYKPRPSQRAIFKAALK